MCVCVQLYDLKVPHPLELLHSTWQRLMRLADFSSSSNSACFPNDEKLAGSDVQTAVEWDDYMISWIEKECMISNPINPWNQWQCVHILSFAIWFSLLDWKFQMISNGSLTECVIGFYGDLNELCTQEKWGYSRELPSDVFTSPNYWCIINTIKCDCWIL